MPCDSSSRRRQLQLRSRDAFLLLREVLVPRGAAPLRLRRLQLGCCCRRSLRQPHLAFPVLTAQAAAVPQLLRRRHLDRAPAAARVRCPQQLLELLQARRQASAAPLPLALQLLLQGPLDPRPRLHRPREVQLQEGQSLCGGQGWGPLHPLEASPLGLHGTAPRTVSRAQRLPGICPLRQPGRAAAVAVLLAQSGDAAPAPQLQAPVCCLLPLPRLHPQARRLPILEGGRAEQSQLQVSLDQVQRCRPVLLQPALPLPGR